MKCSHDFSPRNTCNACYKEQAEVIKKLREACQAVLMPGNAVGLDKRVIGQLLAAIEKATRNE